MPAHTGYNDDDDGMHTLIAADCDTADALMCGCCNERMHSFMQRVWLLGYSTQLHYNSRTCNHIRLSYLL